MKLLLHPNLSGSPVDKWESARLLRLLLLPLLRE